MHRARFLRSVGRRPPPRAYRPRTHTRAGSSTTPACRGARHIRTAGSAPASRFSSASSPVCASSSRTGSSRRCPPPLVDGSRSTRRSATAEGGSGSFRWRQSAVHGRQADRLGGARPRADSADHRQVRDLTGSAQTAYTVAVLPRVDVAGNVAGEKVDATFAPALSFDAGDLRLQPASRAARVSARSPPRARHRNPRRAGRGLARRALALGRQPLAVCRCSGSQRCSCSVEWRSQPDAAVRTATSTSGSRPATARCSSLSLRVGRLGARDRARRDGGARAARGAPGQADPPVGDGNDRSYVVEDGSTAYRYSVYSPEPVTAMVWPPPPTTSAHANETREARSFRRGRSGVWARAGLRARGHEHRLRVESRARHQLDHPRPEEAEARLQRDHRHRHRHGRRQRGQRGRAGPRPCDGAMPTCAARTATTASSAAAATTRCAATTASTSASAALARTRSTPPARRRSSSA